MKTLRRESPTRRTVLLGAVAALILTACNSKGKAAGAEPKSSGYENDPWRRLSDAEWRARLTPAAYEVLREDGTERPNTSALNDEKRAGTFHCAGCDLPLFASDTKYDSGTGWPSFFDVIPGAVGTKPDRKFLVTRTEYHCIRCLGHQGHVFDDGPPPTGLRYCNNGVALTFKPA